jgi:DUF1680 family protein
MSKATKRKEAQQVEQTRRAACKTLVGASIGMAAAPAAPAAVAGAKNPLEAFDYTGVKLKGGMLSKQTEQVRDVFLNVPDESFLWGFRKRAGHAAPGQSLGGWYGDDLFHAFGQYLSGMARLAKALGDQRLAEKVKGLVSEWAKTISPQGFFFYTTAPKPPMYIYDKMMCGLVDAYRYAGVNAAAPLMARITKWAEANLDRSRKPPTRPNNANEWYTLSENLYRAFEATGEADFRRFGDFWNYPSFWNMFTRQAAPDPFNAHAYSHVNSLSGAAMLYRLTREQHYLDVTVNAFQWLERTQMFATGGFGPNESLLPPDGSLGRALEGVTASFETACSSWAGFRLSRYLIESTGDSIYGDWAEKLVYNGIGAALPLQADGRTFYYSDYTLGKPIKVYYPKLWPCCSGTYPQAIAEYHRLTYFRGTDTLAVNLYVPSTVEWNHAGNPVRVEQDTDYPEANTTTLTVHPARPDTFKLQFRVPRWCQPGASVEINGKPASGAFQAGAWGVIDRNWTNGDSVKITFPMEHAIRTVDLQHPNRAAFTYGAVALVGKGHGNVVRRNGRLAQSFTRTGAGLEFELENIAFVPFYRLGLNEPYQLYWQLQ